MATTEHFQTTTVKSYKLTNQEAVSAPGSGTGWQKRGEDISEAIQGSKFLYAKFSSHAAKSEYLSKIEQTLYKKTGLQRALEKTRAMVVIHMIFQGERAQFFPLCVFHCHIY